MQRGSSLALLENDFYNDIWPRYRIFGGLEIDSYAARLSVTVNYGSRAACDARAGVDFIDLTSRNDSGPLDFPEVSSRSAGAR